MRKILVTGGMGFIGSNFIRFMLKRHKDMTIVNLDKLTYAGNPANLADVKQRHRFIHGDVCDPVAVDSAMEGCEAVVHFAAETHVDRSIIEAGDFVRTDVYGTFVILEAARRRKLKRFVQISTDEVYGEAEEHPCLETDNLMPKSPYAASKAGADRLAWSYFATYGLPVTITRCSNNYGPYQYPEKLIPLFVTNALEGKKLPIYGTGKNTRDWIFVEDHCSAIDAILQAEGVEGEVFNISSGNELSVLQITDRILKRLDRSKDLLSFVPDRPGHVRRHAVDSRKLRKALGWRPEHSVDEAMKSTIDWYMRNEAWWKPLKSV
ncbi:MAG: dTDP-glucose 4,6-dehydratase [Methanomassiliicoccales archaeon]|nr:dTDP-glucose 4,6-dehydratase [Methanomassiliicoccales archaeon]